MKVFKKDLKKGKIDFSVSSLDDLWFLSNLIEEGDFVSSKTERKVKVSSSESADSVKKSFFLNLEVESISFQGSILRVSGVVTEGNDFVPKGSHHTINVQVSSFISVVKESWKKFHLDLIDDAIKGFSNKILVLLVDRDKALFADINSSGFNILGELSGNVKNKLYDSGGENFFSKVYSHLIELNNKLSPENIIVASSAFWKQDFMKEVKEPEIKKKIFLTSCDDASPQGLNNLLKSSSFSKFVKDSKVFIDSQKVDEFLSEISKEGLVCYGFDDIVSAVDSGAVESLLVTTKSIKNSEANRDIKKLMSSVDVYSGKIFIIDSENDAGSRLDGLGGVGAFLRFRF